VKKTLAIALVCNF